VAFCVAAVEEALARFGSPEIFNTDQGSQFTSPQFTVMLMDATVRISMDGRGRWMDNVLYKSALDLSDIVRCNRLRAASLMVWRCVADLKPGVFDAPLRGCGA
jgi:hypothetical protein